MISDIKTQLCINMDYEDNEDNWTIVRYGNRQRRAARNDAAATWRRLNKDPFAGSNLRNGPDDDGAPVRGDRRQDPSYDRRLQREWWAHLNQPSGPTAPRYGRFQRYPRAGR